MIELFIIPGAMIVFLLTWLEAETVARSQTTKLPPPAPIAFIEPAIGARFALFRW